MMNRDGDDFATRYLNIEFDCGLGSDGIEDRTMEIEKRVMTINRKMDYLSSLVTNNKGQKDNCVFEIIKGSNSFGDFIKEQTLKVLEGLPYETKVKILDLEEIKGVLH